MRLLEIQHDGTIALTEDLIGAGNVPAYAILSHTWLPGQEVTFDEFNRGLGRDKAGFDKIRFCAQQARGRPARLDASRRSTQPETSHPRDHKHPLPCPYRSPVRHVQRRAAPVLVARASNYARRGQGVLIVGIFGVFTFLNYGEGESNAFSRLRKAIAEDSQESSQPNAYAVRKPSYYIPFQEPILVGRREE
ncbi:unnamed protein product [Alternaria alternata]